MVSRFTKIFRSHDSEDQREVTRSPRKRKSSKYCECLLPLSSLANLIAVYASPMCLLTLGSQEADTLMTLPSSLDIVAPDSLVTPGAKRVRFSPKANKAERDGVPVITRLASWVRMKATSFGSTYWSRALPNGTEADHNGPVDHNNQDGRRQQASNSVRHAERHITVRPKKQANDADLFTQPDLSSREFARRPLHGSSQAPPGSGRQPQQSDRPPQQSDRPPPSRHHHHHHQQHSRLGNGASPDLPVMKDKVESWHRFHMLRTDISSSSSRHKDVSTIASNVATRGSSSIHDRLFNTTTSPRPVKPGPSNPRPVNLAQSYRSNASLSRYSTSLRKSTVEECVRLQDRQKYQELLQQYTALPLARTLPQESFLLDRTALNRTQEVTVTQPKEQTVVISASPILFDLTRSRSPSLTGSQASARREPPAAAPASPKPSKVMAMKQARVTSPCIDLTWVEEMKEKFESSVRLSKRNIEEQTKAYKQFQEKRELEKKRAEERVQALIITVRESTIHDVESEFPLLESDLKPEVIEVIEDEEEEGEPLPELTDDMEAEVDGALRPGPGNQELVSGFRIQLTRCDIQTLNGLNWLNDEVVNFYFNLLADRSEKHSENFPKVHTFNTFFYPKLVKDGYNSLRRWTKKVDVFSKDILLVPVHLGVHWCLATIDFRSKCITYFDSMGGDNDKCLNALREYLASEHQDKKKAPYNLSDWELGHAKDIPLQLNGSDCGVFACKFAEYATRDSLPTFSQEDMPYFRRRMVWELLHKQLL